MRLEYDAATQTLYIHLEEPVISPAGEMAQDWRTLPRVVMYGGTNRPAQAGIEQVGALVFVPVPPDYAGEAFAFLPVYRHEPASGE